jgi:hypothetical protein
LANSAFYDRIPVFLFSFSIPFRLIREIFIREKYENEAWKKCGNLREFELKIKEGENEESTMEKMTKALEEIERKRNQEEKIRTNWYYLEAGGISESML